MTRSETVNELAKALSATQGELAGAKKDAANPFFNSKYADLASVWDACRGPLAKHGLSIVQSPRLAFIGEDQACVVEVETTLLHDSGQWMADTLAVPVTKVDAQGVGSAITYARRYSLAAIVGVAPEEDDAEAAVGRANGAAAKAAPGVMEAVTAKVLGVTKRDMGNWTKFTITADDHRNYSTKKQADATVAKDAQEAGLSVDIAYNTSKWGREIVTIKETAVAEPVL